MQHIEINTSPGVWMVMQYDDLTALTVVKDDRNDTYLEGDVTFTDTDYDFLFNKKVSDRAIQLTVRWNGYQGAMSLAGEWKYDIRECKLKVENGSLYADFKTILNKENNPLSEQIGFEFDSYIDTKYCSNSQISTIYPNYSISAETAPLVVLGNTYVAAATSPDGSGGNYYWGSDVSFISFSGRHFACILDHVATSDTTPTSGTDWQDYWVLVDGSTSDEQVETIKQERAKFEFSGSVFNELQRYWEKGSTTTDTYTSYIYGYDIKENMSIILQSNGYTLSTDWLSFASNINSDYDGYLYLVNTKNIEKVKLNDLVQKIEQLFNCKHYLNSSGELYFLHKSEENIAWNSSLPTEHYLIYYDIYNWNQDDFSKVKRHRLNFTESDLGTHDNSVIEYDNNYLDDAEVKLDADVDFVYAVNETDIDCVVTIDPTTRYIKEISNVYNPYLIPSDLHQNFYFVGREFTHGTFAGNLVSLQIDYLEKTDYELPNNLSIDNFNVFYNVLLPSYASGSVIEGAIEKVVYSIDKCNFKVSLKTKI